MNFHLLASYSLMASRNATLWVLLAMDNRIRNLGRILHLHRIQRSACPSRVVSVYVKDCATTVWTYLVPMLLDTPFSSSWKGLVRYQTLQHVPQFIIHLTLAISLQLLPKSRICLSLCSSSAVHGVLVLPFFLGGLSTIPPEISDTTGATTADPGIVGIPVTAVVTDGGERLFLELTCCCCCCC